MAARRRPSSDEPLEDFVEAVGRVPTQQLKKALVAVYQGLSPMLGSVMAARVPGLTAATKVGDISPEQWSALYSGPWKRWLEVIGDGGGGAASSGSSDVARAAVPSSQVSPVPTTPWISEDGASYYPTTLGEEWGGEGEGIGTGGATVGGVGEFDGNTADSGGGGGDRGRRAGGLTKLEKVMEVYYRGTQSNEEFEGLKRRCLSRVTATLAKLRERGADFEDQLAAAQEDKVSAQRDAVVLHGGVVFTLRLDARGSLHWCHRSLSSSASTCRPSHPVPLCTHAHITPPAATVRSLS